MTVRRSPAALRIDRGLQVDTVRAEIGRTEENIVQVEQEVVAVAADRHQDRIVVAPADLVVRNRGGLDLAVEHGGIVQNIDKVRKLLAEVEVQAGLDPHGIGQGGKVALGLLRWPA